MDFTENKTYNASIKGFRYNSSMAMLVVSFDDKNYNIIIGSKQDFPIADLMNLKGLSTEFTYKGVKNVNGVDYPRFSMECVVF